MIRIGILTSSRADFGIYLPLLQEMKINNYFHFSIIAFGTHLSRFHGYSKSQIIDSGFEVDYHIESLLLGDTPDANSTATGLTYLKFSSFWNTNGDKFDLIFCLGDRFEMFAAVCAGIPFGIKFAHIHGGETTLGAIDNIYRHAITLASNYHFTATDYFTERVCQIINSSKNVFTVGSLSLDNLLKVKLLSIEDFNLKWNIDLTKPTILVTFHTETVAFNKVEIQSNIVLDSIIEMSSKFQILLTMPNADTMGALLREQITLRLSDRENIFIYENLGTQSYFSAMKYCLLVFGNSSSGIIEAASFNKFVINIGKRQEGRMSSSNVINVNFNLKEIESALENIKDNNYYFDGQNIYYRKDVAKTVLQIIKDNFCE